MAEIPIPENHRQLTDYAIDFTVNEEINAIVIGFNCGLALGQDRTRVIYLDNLEIQDIEVEPFDYNGSISQIGTSCDQDISLQVEFDIRGKCFF